MKIEYLKPHKGRISNWTKVEYFPDTGKYFIRGRFVDHPSFAGERGYTSYLVKHDEMTGEIETRNSRYTLV